MAITSTLRAWLAGLASPLALARAGIMGMNERNCGYVGLYNRRSLYPVVDNKLITKQVAAEHGVRTPRLLGAIRTQADVDAVSTLLGDHTEFCIKPAHGSGGKGILVIRARAEDGRGHVKASGAVISEHNLRRHLTNILAGLFSIGGRQDVALVEELIHVDPAFADYSYEGLPDTRVIVFQGFPVMCMMRLATAGSDGKANLHQGAVGVGICLRTGRAVRAVQRNQPIEIHPDTGKNLLTLRLPHFPEILRLASQCHEMSGLGYIGTDIVLDRERGPMLLELNARPGLAIQVCNNAGLLPRLRLVEELVRHTTMTIDERIAFSREHFGVFSE